MVIPFQVVMLPLTRLLQTMKNFTGIPFKDTYYGSRDDVELNEIIGLVGNSDMNIHSSFIQFSNNLKMKEYMRHNIQKQKCNKNQIKCSVMTVHLL